MEHINKQRGEILRIVMQKIQALVEVGKQIKMPFDHFIQHKYKLPQEGDTEVREGVDMDTMRPTEGLEKFYELQDEFYGAVNNVLERLAENK